MDGLSGAASVIAAIQLADRVLTICGKYAVQVRNAKEEVERLSAEVESLSVVLKKVDQLRKDDASKLYSSRSNLEELEAVIQRCHSELHSLECDLGPSGGRKVMSKFGRRALKWPFKSGEVTKIIVMLDRHKATLNMALNLDQRVDFAIAEHDRQIGKLPLAQDAAFSSQFWENKSRCLPDTRLEVREMAKRWMEDPDSKCIFWLKGMAGTGKSTIARTVAEMFSAANQPVASFFFSRGHGDLGNATKFFTTLAWQLANKPIGLKSHISKSIVEAPQAIQDGLAEQWKHLILRPLQTLDKSLSQPQTIIVVIDALDECDPQEKIRLILQLLPQARSLRMIRLRVFVTSRPETSIREEFDEMPGDAYRDFAMHQIGQAITEKDIHIFLVHELEGIRKKFKLKHAWPSDQEIRRLALQSSGLFIYADTACRFIRTRKYSLPQESLALLLHDSVDRSADISLDDIYSEVLTQSVLGEAQGKDREELSEKFRDVAGPLVVLFDTLPSQSYSRLIHRPVNQVQAVLGDLHSVLDIPENPNDAVQLLHPSFRDFLVNAKRAPPSFYIHESNTHAILAESCLMFMSTNLKKNICGIRAGTIVSEVPLNALEVALPPELQYSCRYWIEHVEKSNLQLQDDGTVHKFLQKNLLQWLEVMSFMVRISEAIQMVINLLSLVSDHLAPHLHNVIQDLRRFILYNRSSIEHAPLQVYCSALIFAPKSSIIRKMYEDQIPKWVQRLPTVPETWIGALLTLDGHSGVTLSVAFSPNGKQLASAFGGSSTVSIWEVTSGATLHILDGHSACVNAVAFAPDGKLLVSGSDDGTIRIWDTESAATVHTLEGRTNEIEDAVFSPDGKQLASGSRDAVIQVWEPTAGTLLHRLDGLGRRLSALAYSRDGQLLASGSWDYTVRLWDPIAGTLCRTLLGHSDIILTLAFSPTVSHQLASGSGDGSVRIWDTTSGTTYRTLQGHDDWVYSTAFSADGKKVATGSSDHTIRLWETATGVALSTIVVHHVVFSVTFSADSKLLASGSADGTVRLWATTQTAADHAHDGHGKYVEAVAFCPSDDRQLASASRENTVLVWDWTLGTVISKLQGHTGAVRSIAWFPGGEKLASGSTDDTIRLWDTATGACLRTLDDHASHVITLTPSPNGEQLASGSWDKTALLWDIASGTRLCKFMGHDGPVSCITFSADGKTLASGSWDTFVRLWNIATGDCINILKHHSGRVHSLAFSPDGEQLASGSSDKTLQLCHVPSGTLLSDIKFRSSVQKIAFCGNSLQVETSDGSAHIGMPSLPIIPTQRLAVVNVRRISCDGDIIIWLPSDYWTTCRAARDNVLALGHYSGQVSFLQFDLDKCGVIE